MNNKRIRSQNWDEEEKQLFRLILKDYAKIIENKSLDNNTTKKKSKAWEEIYKKFNELNSRHRDLSQLKIHWKKVKVEARKTCSTYRAATNKTGGGTRPATPDDAAMEIRDLLNPAELLRDFNEYDSDGILQSKLENVEYEIISETHPPISQDSEQITFVIETSDQKENEEEVSLTTPAKQVSKANMSIIVDNVENEKVDFTTPAKKVSSVSKRKININNNRENSKSRKDDYITNITNHTKTLKDEEHRRRMAMAEEEHAVKMEILKEQLKSAQLEREILMLKKERTELH